MNNQPVVLYRRPLGIDGPWEDERCGTYAGWDAHKLLGEYPCRPCRNAQAAYVRQLRHRGSCARSPRVPDGYKATGLGWPMAVNLPGQ